MMHSLKTRGFMTFGEIGLYLSTKYNYIMSELQLLKQGLSKIYFQAKKNKSSNYK